MMKLLRPVVIAAFIALPAVCWAQSDKDAGSSAGQGPQGVARKVCRATGTEMSLEECRRTTDAADASKPEAPKAKPKPGKQAGPPPDAPAGRKPPAAGAAGAAGRTPAAGARPERADHTARGRPAPAAGQGPRGATADPPIPGSSAG
jgi:hypothetical protein